MINVNANCENVNDSLTIWIKGVRISKVNFYK